MSSSNKILAVDGLTIGAGGESEVAPVVDRIDLTLAQGSALGIAGESGSGKSTLLLAMMGVVKPGLELRAGTCRFGQLDLFAAPPAALEKLRGGRLALVPQNAGLALTPNIRIGDQIAEVLRYHAGPADQERHNAHIAELLALVRLPDPELLGRRFPHELSGGQLQRVGIAMALAGQPDLLLLDEPTTGLDVTTQLGILELLEDIRRKQGMAMVCVSHDLGVLARLCGDIAIMYAGRLVEQGPATRLLTQPAHPYSRALLASIPRLASAGIPTGIPGRPPAPDQALAGCRFAPRCRHADRTCSDVVPPSRDLTTGHLVACHHPQLGMEPGSAVAKLATRQHPGATEARLLVDGLSVTYQRRGLLPGLRQTQAKRALDRVSLILHRSEILGLVGESGSGKSTLLKALAGLWPVLEGRAVMDEHRDLTEPVQKRDRDSLRRMQLIFQNPDASLNPRHTIREILSQPLRLYFSLSRTEVEARASRLLGDVRLDASYLDRQPAELSGGERQRVAIARAFAAEPDVILCDEITSALDVSVQASVLQIIRELTQEKQVACLFVSHDLAVVNAIADRIAVLYRGQLVELGEARQVCAAPAHTYTRQLLAAVLEPPASGGGTVSGAPA
ncbi:peptide/nickel transport system ATP-binding protein [Dongia mobilis]|uniref:Peptide/nickel transport system ATP-binding protein n=1 Tax=Dongia mobilis TaxID=578943 RepID=A0A4R6WTM1_9PROT|nr:ABC transporter ATP-binding protein [Dongia mobilis]TDQ82993.1 peptide/nickel transport system ATP-binding protein [Dongia mobilis]